MVARFSRGWLRVSVKVNNGGGRRRGWWKSLRSEDPVAEGWKCRHETRAAGNLHGSLSATASLIISPGQPRGGQEHQAQPFERVEDEALEEQVGTPRLAEDRQSVKRQ
jgi:hypothetical protein